MKHLVHSPLVIALAFQVVAACSSEDGASATPGNSTDTGGTTSGGTGGSATGGAPSTGGSAGSAGAPGTGGATSNFSAGCTEPAEQAKGTWVNSTVNVDGNGRPYATWLPEGYDPTRGYPVILLLHGCGSGTNNLPMENHTGSDAILVRGTGSGADTCWNDNNDLPFIDAMVDDVKARFCTDNDRYFAVGYSSGSWIASLLSCARSDVFRGIGTVAGGENPGPSPCRGPIARMFFNDVGDPYNDIDWARPGRDRLVRQNECDEPQQSDPVDPSPCVSYRGCEPGYPVVWCETTGHGHDRRDNVAAPAFWTFFQDLD